MKNFADVVCDNYKKIILGLAVAIVAVVASAPIVLSDEISAEGKGDLLPIAEDGVNHESNHECKTDLGVDAKDGCQTQLKITMHPVVVV